MKTKVGFFALISFAVLSMNAQQTTKASVADYKHPQLASKAKEMVEAETPQTDEVEVVEFVRNANYKDQTNNLLKVTSKTRRKRLSFKTEPVTEPRKQGDYKHPNGL